MSSLTADERLPWIFLSHSGQQKDFVTDLYHALRLAKHHPFFDKDSKDSLPSGLDYPTRIFEACRSCKMGVVVLTEDYVSSLWPMLELQHLLMGPADRPIYPLFYSLKPVDLSRSDNLERWEEHWKQKALAWQSRMQELQEHMASPSNGSCGIQINLDIASWRDNLKKLQYRSGEVHNVFHLNPERSFYESKYRYIQVIVDNICARLPPPMEFLLEVGVVGEKRMQQEINQVFEKEGSLGDDGVRVIGVYGIGGSGKSTLCKMMANFYGNEFSGRCFSLELPTPGEGGIGKDDILLLERIKALLGYAGTNRLSHIDQAMGALQEQLRRNKFFLAIDNIWAYALKSETHEDFQYTKSFEYAKSIMLMEFAPEAKIMLTSRSKEILSLLLESRPAMRNKMMGNGQFRPSVVHVPTLTHAEAVDSLKFFYGFRSSFIPEDCLQRLARSCFFKRQCHPFYLKLKAVELEQKGRTSFTDQQWRDLISSLEVPDGASWAQDSNSATNNNYSEQVVRSSVNKSLDALPANLQDIFIDLATWPSFDYVRLRSHIMNIDILTFVRYHYDDCTEDAMFFKVLQLQHHGLLEIEFDSDYCEGDAGGPCKTVIHDLLKLVAKSRVSLPDVHSVVKDAIFEKDLSVVTSTDDELLQKKHVSVSGKNLKASTWKALFGSSTTSLSRVLLLKRSNPMTVQIRSLLIGGPVLLGRSWYRSVVRHICPAASVPWRRLCLKNNGRDLKALRVLHLHDIDELREIEGWEGVPNLMVLSLSMLIGLKRIGSIGCLRRLERLALCRCVDLEVQALVGAGAGMSLVKPGDKLQMLQHLIVECNTHLTEVGPHLFDAFPALKLLQLRNCIELESFPDLNSGKLRTLDLEGCWKLRSIEGISDSSLTALQRLVLKDCFSLKRMSDISKVKSTDLRVLDARWCPSEVGNQLRLMMESSCCGHIDDNRLRELDLTISIPSEKYINMNGTDDEVSSTSYSAAASSSNAIRPSALRLGDALLSCDQGSSQYNCRKLQLNTVNELGMVQFVHLKSLGISGELQAEYPCWLDVSGLPHNLEKLKLRGFESVQKLVMSSSLVNLTCLFLRLATKEKLLFDADAQLPSLRKLSLSCPNLEKLLFDADAQLPSLQSLTICGCTALRSIPNLRHLRALKHLQIWYPGDCWELRKKEDFQELVNDGVEVELKFKDQRRIKRFGCWELSKKEDLQELVYDRLIFEFICEFSNASFSPMDRGSLIVRFKV